VSISKRIHVMNGWQNAPHQWWRFLLLPFGWDFGPWKHDQGWFSVSMFGFTFIWLKRGQEN
jgi:hypothetical protein